MIDRGVIDSVMEHTDRPVVMPLSNPTDHAEAIPADLYRCTNGRVLMATGSPFPDVLHDGKPYRIGQANNVFVFPGVGLGVLASGAREVKPEFFTAAARAVAECVSKEDIDQGALLPPVTTLADVSLKVAQAVGESAMDLGVSRNCAFSTFQHHNDPARLRELIRKMRWTPDYLPISLSSISSSMETRRIAPREKRENDCIMTTISREYLRCHLYG